MKTITITEGEFEIIKTPTGGLWLCHPDDRRFNIEIQMNGMQSLVSDLEILSDENNITASVTETPN